MSTSVTQIKVSLPDPLYDYLNSKAGKFGLTLSSYVKNLIIDDVKDMDMPVFKMSEKTEEVASQALNDHARGKTYQIYNVDKFLDSL